MELEGYYCMTSRASATAFDVSATYIGENPELNILQRLVQVKTNSGYSKQVIEDLRMYSRMFIKNGSPVRIEVHNWKAHQRRPDILVIGNTKEEDYQI